MVIKRGDGYWVLSDARDKVLGGPYRTRAEAEKVLNAAIGPRVQPAHLRSMAELDESRRTLH